MLPGFLLALREGVEAALVVGIVIGALRKMQRQDLTRYVWWGTICAAAVSFLAAIVLQFAGASLEGNAEAIFEGFEMLLAAGVLTWMVFWMHKQSRSLKADLESDARRAILRAGGRGLFFLALIAVVREGFELALFLTASALAAGAAKAFAGAVLGIAAAAGLGWLLFTTTVRLNLKRFFQVTGVLLILFAAGLVAHGVHEFIEVGWIPAVIEPVWNLNPILTEDSILGQMLKTLFGYNPSPSLTEILAYSLYFLAVLIGLRVSRPLLPNTQQA